MRVISSEELGLVSGGVNGVYTKVKQTSDSGGGFWDSIGGFFSDLFGGSSGGGGNSCMPSSNTAGGTTITQTCGAGGVSTVIITGRGYVSQATSTPNPGVSVSGNYGPAGIHGAYIGGYTVTTTTCIGGKCNTKPGHR